MAGISDRPFRQLCRQMGAGAAVSEMLTCQSQHWHSEKTRLRLDHQNETGPIIMQIAGSDPDMLAEAAQFNVRLGANIIDINMGCPAKKVCKVAAGSALLKDEPLVEQILNKVVNSVRVPVTLKIRTGWDQSHRNAIRIAKIAENAGIAALTIHGRTRADAFTGEAEYATIRSVKATTTLPIIANGDIGTLEKAKEVLTYTKADAVMLGRATLGKPWIFRQFTDAIPLSLAQKIALIFEHLDALYQFYGDEKGVKIARKHLLWYLEASQISLQWRTVLLQAVSPIQQYQCLQQIFDHYEGTLIL